MGKKKMDYAELTEAYYKLYNDNTDLLDVKRENDKLKKKVKDLEKEVIELSCLLSVRMEGK